MASKRRLRRRSCEGKFRFDSKEEAVDALISMKGKTKDLKLHTYKCKFGDKSHWHIGH